MSNVDDWPDQSGNEYAQPVTSLYQGHDSTSWKEISTHGAIVVKIGGSTLGSHDTTLEDLVDMQRRGVQSVVIHGGGKVITEWMVKQGVRPKFIRGLRVTDRSSLDIVVAVLAGVINKSIVRSIEELGGKAIGLSGVDGGMLRAEVMAPELGFVGRMVEVDARPIKTVMGAGFIPVIAPVAASVAGDTSLQGSLLNVNADTVAGEVAIALEAGSLLFMTDVKGVMDSSNRLIPRLTQCKARGLIRSNVVAGGMLPKIDACLRALEEVETTHIVDGRMPHTLRDSLSGETLGTRVG